MIYTLATVEGTNMTKKMGQNEKIDANNTFTIQLKPIFFERKEEVEKPKKKPVPKKKKAKKSSSGSFSRNRMGRGDPDVDENELMRRRMRGGSDHTPANMVDLSYTHIQTTPTTTWTVTHNLNKYPSVSIVDSANSEVDGVVQYIDENSLTITFSVAFGGRAFLN